MPLVSRTFDQLIDFTRTSAATYVDASGRIVPTPASRNLLTFTQEFDNAAWVKGAATVTANATTAPDGTITADKVVATAASGGHAVYEASPSLTNATTYTYSFYVKASGYSLVRLAEGGNGFFYASFDLANQTVVSGTTGGGQFVSAAIVSAGDGWFRCSVVFTSSGGQVYPALIGYPAGAALNGFGAQYTGDGTSGVFLWGAQLEAASTATDYTRNNGGVFPPRFDYDPVTLAPKGLLIEEQRTNLLLRSEEFENASWDKSIATITANYAVSPDGTADADRFVSAGGSFPQIAQSVTVLTGDHTVSIYVKSDGTSQIQQTLIFDGSSVNFTPTDTWTRITLTKNVTVSAAKSVVIATNSASAAASSFLIWGAQLEAGSFATSYIPTVASQVTRTADVATITGANFSQWYNQSEGTFVAQFDMIGGSAANTNNQIVLSPIADASNRHIIYNADAQIAGYTVVGGVTQAYLPMGSLAANTTSKMAYAYQVNNFAASQNGGAVSTDTSGSLPVPTLMGIGSGGLGGNQLNGHIRSIRYYPTRLSNAQLQALTA